MKHAAPIRKTSLARSANPIPKKRRTARRGPMRDPLYRDWVRSLPCAACFPEIYRLGVLGVEMALCEARPFRSEFAHTGPHGLSQKVSDHDGIPLESVHHRTGPDSYHASAHDFFERFGLQREDLIADLRSVYRRTL